MKSQVNFRAATVTAQELDQLIKLLGETQTEVIARSISHLHNTHHNRLHFEIAQAEHGSCPWCGWQYEEITHEEW